MNIIGEFGFAIFLEAIAIWARRNAAPAKWLFSTPRSMADPRAKPCS
jgi:hypothetical protein